MSELPRPSTDTKTSTHTHAPGELFPGRASKRVYGPHNLPSGATWVPREPQPSEPLETTPPPNSPALIPEETPRRRFSASRLASEQAFRQAEISSVSVDELPTSFLGIRRIWQDRRIKRIEGEIQKQKEEDATTALWAEAARNGESFGVAEQTGAKNYRKGDRLWPSTQREEAVAQNAFRTRDHKRPEVASTGVHSGGVYEIDRDTGLSRLRIADPELEGYTKETRKSIRKRERAAQRNIQGIRHAEHILNPEHEQHARMKQLEDKLKDAEAKQSKVLISKGLKPVRKTARKAYRMDKAHAWMKETDEELRDRTAFYRDLGWSLQRTAEDGKPTPMTRTLDTPRPGRIRDSVARTRAGMLANRFKYNLERDKTKRAGKQGKVIAARGTTYQRGMFGKRRAWTEHLKSSADLGSARRHRDLKSAQRRFVETHRAE
jgi:hypothetical protein